MISCVDGSFYLCNYDDRGAKFEVEGDVMPAFSKVFSSFLSQLWCLRDSVYGFDLGHLCCL